MFCLGTHPSQSPRSRLRRSVGMISPKAVWASVPDCWCYGLFSTAMRKPKTLPVVDAGIGQSISGRWLFVGTV